MKILRALTLLTAVLLIACGGNKSSFTSESSQSSSQISSSESSESSSAVSSSSVDSSISSQIDSSSSISSSISSMDSSSSSSSSSRPSYNEDYVLHAYDDYYLSIQTWDNGTDLKDKLYTLSRKTYKPLTYTDPNYESNINADHSYYDYEYLDVVYSENDVYKTDTNRGWQREHAFCASLMCGSLTADAVKNKGRATDFHNLFASNASANSSRGNKNYGNADKTNEYYQNRTTNNGQDGYSFDPVNFEPADKDKGRLARAIFYMAMMYKNDEVDTVNGITMKGLKIVEDPVTYVQGENGAFAIGNLSTLLDWNKKYPVDYLEMQHNISVYKDVYTSDGYAQGNRNPFVDFPELVDYVYGDKKDDASMLVNLIPSEYTLQCESWYKIPTHYALKEAKRSYDPGTKIANNDYKIVKVYSNYEEEVVNEGFTHSLADHTFSTNDGQSITAIINAGNDTIKYQITINASGGTSTGEIIINTTGINKGKPGEDQEVTYSDIPFLLSFESSAAISTSNAMTITNINQDGKPVGITFGSKTKPLTKLTLTTKDSYTINAAYIKTFVGNVDSSYQLTIKVGDNIILDSARVNSTDAKQFGDSIASPLTGQLSYIFTGSSSLKINSIAFNEIIA